MSQSFAALGVSAPLVRGSRPPRHQVTRSRSRSSSSRTRSPASTSSRSADRLGQDARLRPPARRAHGRRRRAPERASCSSRRASSPRRSPTTCSRSRSPQGLRDRRGLRRHVRGGQAKKARGAAHPRRDSGPAPRPARAAPHLARGGARRSSSTRPTGCSTWASSPQVDRILARSRRTVRRCSSRRRSTAPVAELARAYTVNASRFRAERPGRARAGDDRARFVPVTAEDKLDRLVEHLERRARARARLRPHEARRRQARAQARSATTTSRAAAMHGNMSQNARERSLAAVRVGPGLDTGRDRRRRARPRRRRHHARDQLRPAPHATRTTSTASAARAAPAAAAPGSPSCSPSSSSTWARSPAASGTLDSFAASGVSTRGPARNGTRRQRSRNRRRAR